MKLIVTLLLLTITLFSCKSEYEERLEQARVLKQRMRNVESNFSADNAEILSSELQTLQKEIQFLAKVSGNEKLFMEEIFND